MGSNPVGATFFRCLKKATIAEIVQISVRIAFLFRLKIFLFETLQNEGWSTGVIGMDRVHEGVHGLGVHVFHTSNRSSLLYIIIDNVTSKLIHLIIRACSIDPIPE